MPIASVHPMVVGRSDALALVQDWAPLEIKWRKKWSTGWTDGFKIGIGAFNVPYSRDDVKRAGAKSSALVEPVVRRSNDVSKGNGYKMIKSHRLNHFFFKKNIASVQPMGANSTAEASEKPTASFSLWVKNRCRSTESSDAHAEKLLTATNG